MTTTVTMNLEQVFTGLARSIDRVDGKPRLKDCFVDAGQDVGVSVADVVVFLRSQEGLAPPRQLLEKLDLGPDCSIDDVAAAIEVLWNAPIVTTPEEEAQSEMDILSISETLEQANAENPDLPQIPVAYPKEKRTRH